MELRLTVTQNNDVIHVPDIILYTQDSLTELVEFVQVDIRKHLTEQVSYRHTYIKQPLLQRHISRGFAGRQSEWSVLAINYPEQNLKQSLILDFLAENVLEHPMRNPVKIFADVKFQIVPISIFLADILQPTSQTSHCSQRSSAGDAAIRVLDISLNQHRIDNSINRPLNHTMFKGD